MNTPKPTATIDYTALHDLLMGKTGNPLAEQDIPKLLSEIIQKGGKVVVTYSPTADDAELIIKDGKFMLSYRKHE